MAITTKQLNNTAVEKAKAKDKPYTLTDGNGLFLLIMPSGSKTWQFNYYRPITKKRTKFRIAKLLILVMPQKRVIPDKISNVL